jgi:hypothetical protein
MSSLTLAIIITALLQIIPARAQESIKPSSKEQAEDSAKKIKELQKERIAICQQVTELLTKLYQKGRVEIDEVIEAHQQLTEAELDAAVKLSDRVAIYKKVIEQLKLNEELAVANYHAARGTMASVLKIRARRLKAEILVEQAKAQETKEGN